jgi:hypothetical protein
MNKFNVSNLELALVENALVIDTLEWIDVNLLNKTIKKYSKYFPWKLLLHLRIKVCYGF